MEGLSWHHRPSSELGGSAGDASLAAVGMNKILVGDDIVHRRRGKMLVVLVDTRKTLNIA